MRTESRYLGSVTDYDIIIIGGQKYTANQIVDKQLIAGKDTPLYRSDFKTVLRTIKSGQPLGRVFSYLKPIGSTHRAALVLYDNPAYSGTPYYVLDESPIDTGFLTDQGTQTIGQEIKAEQDKQLQDNSPIEYYLKTYGPKVLLIGGGVYLVATYGREFIKDKILSKGRKQPALAGPALAGPALLLLAKGVAIVGGALLIKKSVKATPVAASKTTKSTQNLVTGSDTASGGGASSAGAQQQTIWPGSPGSDFMLPSILPGEPGTLPVFNSGSSTPQPSDVVTPSQPITFPSYSQPDPDPAPSPVPKPAWAPVVDVVSPQPVTQPQPSYWGNQLQPVQPVPMQPDTQPMPAPVYQPAPVPSPYFVRRDHPAPQPVTSSDGSEITPPWALNGFFSKARRSLVS